jgi:hypothetical protein
MPHTLGLRESVANGPTVAERRPRRRSLYHDRDQETFAWALSARRLFPGAVYDEGITLSRRRYRRRASS